jgi:hypothetical protein
LPSLKFEIDGANARGRASSPHATALGDSVTQTRRPRSSSKTRAARSRTEPPLFAP